MADQFKRQTAYKVWISDLLSAEYVRSSGEFEPNYLKIVDLNVSRVNLIGTVVDRSVGDDQGFVSLVVDDGSASVDLRVWADDSYLINDLDIGDFILVVGKVREFNNSIYILPEIAKKLDSPIWFKFRRLELLKLYGEPRIVERVDPVKVKEPVEIVGGGLPEPLVEDIVIEENVEQGSEVANLENRAKIISLVESLDGGEGAIKDKLVLESGILIGEVDVVLDDLLKSGEVFEIKPGSFRLLP